MKAPRQQAAGRSQSREPRIGPIPDGAGRSLAENWQEPGTGWSLLVLTIVTLACLLPFLGKPFHMDDPLFIWTARQVQSHPFHFYGFKVNWEGTEEPMAAVMQNPPLAAYYLALVGSLLGWSEVALHGGSLLPALAAVLGTYYLARCFCAHPLAAALTTVTAPVFLLSSTGVMCDTLMLAFWVWSVFFWVQGLKQGSPWQLLVAGLLIAACGLTKYFGISLIPLLLTYSLMERSPLRRWLGFLALPVIALAGYQWLTHRLYGRGLLLNAAAYATHLAVGGELPAKLLAGLAFSGGCLAILLPAAALLWGRKGLAAGAAAVAVIGLAVVAMKKVGVFPVVEAGQVKWLFVAQLSLWVVAGASLLALAAADLAARHTSSSALLALWVAGSFAFASIVNWTVSGRNILPVAPAVAVLLLRRLEMRAPLGSRHGPGRLWGPLAVALGIGLVVAWADYQAAAGARTAAAAIKQTVGAEASALRFEGHWGFQYYMEQLGAKALDRADLRLSPNEAIVVPSDNSYLFPLPRGRVVPWFTYQSQAATELTTMSSPAGVGYYSDGWGPLPFAFGPVPAEPYQVFRVP